MSGTGEVTQQQAEPTLRETLLEGFNQLEQQDKPATPTPAADAPPPVIDKPAPTGLDQRPRDETGKFIAKPKDHSPVTGDAAAVQPVPAAPGLPVVPPPVAADPWSKAPESWKPDYRGDWGKIDPGYQRYIHEREQEMRAGIEQAIPKANLADRIMEVAEPYMNTIRGLGKDLPAAVGGLMKIDNDLRTLPFEDKVRLLTSIAAGYGVDLTGAAQNATASFSPEVQELRNKVLALEGSIQSDREQTKAERERIALQEIQSFSDTAEYFDDVKPTMIQLLQGRMADSIPDAYDKAVRLTPDIFDKIHSGKQAAADAEKRKAADDAAKRAKAAAVSPKSATPGAPKPNGARDRRSVLAEQFDNLSERL